MTINWPWVTSFFLHGILILLLFFAVLPDQEVPLPRPTRVEIQLPVLGQDYGVLGSSFSQAGGSVGAFPSAPSSSLGLPENFPDIPGSYYSEVLAEHSAVLETAVGFPAVSFDDLYKETTTPSKTASLVWEEGSESVEQAGFPEVDDLPILGDLDVAWTGTVTPLGQWKDLPSVSSGIPELDSRINSWLLGLDIRPSPTGQEFVVRFRLKVSVRKPQ